MLLLCSDWVEMGTMADSVLEDDFDSLSLVQVQLHVVDCCPGALVCFSSSSCEVEFSMRYVLSACSLCVYHQ